MAINPMNQNRTRPFRSNQTPSQPEAPTTIPTEGSQETTPTTVSTTNPQSFLYDVGLQNIFEDYQKQTQMLNQREQQSLQDAYYIREMSKKYLGEYSSNLGVGDVSGNLLDIYGQYQQTVSQIQTATGQAELGLEQQYTQARRELELQKTLSETTGQDTTIPIISPSDRYLPDGSENPDFIEDFDISVYYGNDPEVGEDSKIFIMGGTEYVSVDLSADEEANKDDAIYTVTSSDINEWFMSKSQDENSIYFRKESSPGTVIQYEPTGLFYVRGTDGRWYRLKQGDNFTTTRTQATEGQKTWYLGSNPQNGEKSGNPQTGIFEYKDNWLGIGNDTYTLTFGDGKTVYTTDGVDNDNIFDATKEDKLSVKDKDILRAFQKEHGIMPGKGVDVSRRSMSEQIAKPSAIYYKGKFYVMTKGGRVFQLKKK